MEDTNVKDVKTLLRLFPYLKNKELAEKLLIDDESLHYISIREFAEKISNIIKNHLEKLEIAPNSAIITDSTAGVGGDTISFAKTFKYVNSIEISEKRAKYLKNNVDIYDLHNVTVYNDDCNNILNKLDNHNVIFIDPPWETVESGSYKQYKNLRLKLGDIPLETFCNNLMNKDTMMKIPELIVLKLPKNMI